MHQYSTLGANTPEEMALELADLETECEIMSNFCDLLKNQKKFFKKLQCKNTSELV